MYKNEKCMSHGLPKEWKSVVHALQTVQQNLFTPPCKPNKTLAKPLLQTLTKPCKPVPNPLCPLRGLHSLHLNKSKRGEYNRGLALQAYLLYKINGSACRSLPIKPIIKGFPRNITKHTKRNMLRHSTNPCGKPSFFPSPLRGTVGVNTNLFRFPSPPWGGRGVNTIKSFRFAKGYRFPPLHTCSPRIRPSQSKQVPVQNN